MLTPAGAEQMYRTVQPKPMFQMVMYVAMLGLAGVIGTILGTLVWSSWFLVSGVIWSIISWIVMIVVFVIVGFLFSAVSQSVIKRQVSTDEALTVIGYAMTPMLLAGFLTNLLSPIGGMGLGGWGFVNPMVLVAGLIGLLALIYSLFLFYIGAKVRFGPEVAVVATIVYAVIAILVGLVVGLIMAAIMAAIFWGGIAGPLGGGGGPSILGGGGSNCVTIRGVTYCG